MINDLTKINQQHQLKKNKWTKKQTSNNKVQYKNSE